MGDVTADELSEIEADVTWWLGSKQIPDDEPPDLDEVATKMGAAIQIAPLGKKEGRAEFRGGVWRAQTRWDLLGTPRGRVVLGHELGHIFAAKVLRQEKSEEWCSAFGVALCAPRRAMRRAMTLEGHAVSRLAVILEIEEAASLLRVGEVAGRPVALERRRGQLVARGEPFEWPPVKAALRARRTDLHPVRVDGERWGLMAA